MPDFASVSAEIVAVGVPVLFLDTCALLDIIRAPMRGLDRCVEAAVELSRMADPGVRKCILVVPSLVAAEWTNNAMPTVVEAKKHFVKLQEQAVRFHEACASIGISIPFGPPDYVSIDLPTNLQRTSKRLLDLALPLDDHVVTKQRAFDRVIAKNPPAQKSQQLKDCAILEECLEVCRRLQAAGFQKKRVFVTSNKNDFCEPGSALAASLAPEFASVDLGFVTDLPWAVNELKT